MRIRTLALAVAAAVLLLAPASALARTTKVVPFETVAGIPLKQSPATVVKELGKPSHTIRVSGKIAEYDFDRYDMSVQFDTLHHPDLSNFVGVSVGPFTKKIAFHTVHGIHIGSTKQAVRRAFGSKCHWSLGQCTLWKGKPGANGSYSFGLVFTGGKVATMVNQFVFNDL